MSRTIVMAAAKVPCFAVASLSNRRRFHPLLQRPFQGEEIMDARTTSPSRWMGVIPMAATLTVVLLASLAPHAASAQSCQSVLQGHADWAVTKPDGPGDYTLLFAVVSNQLNLNATYVEGGLHHQLSGASDVFTGTGKQYFSKRRHGLDYPFNPNQTDNVAVSLNADTSKATVTVANATYVFDLYCDHLGVLYGTGNPQFFLNLATPMFVFSLKRSVVPNGPS